MIKEMSFAVAMKHFFGFREGERTAEFMLELKALTDKDRADFKDMLEGAGYVIKS